MVNGIKLKGLTFRKLDTGEIVKRSAVERETNLSSHQLLRVIKQGNLDVFGYEIVDQPESIAKAVLEEVTTERFTKVPRTERKGAPATYNYWYHPEKGLHRGNDGLAKVLEVTVDQLKKMLEKQMLPQLGWFIFPRMGKPPTKEMIDERVRQGYPVLSL